MFKWIERSNENDDKKFVEGIQNSEYLSNLCRKRNSMLQIMLAVFIFWSIWILVAILVLSPSNMSDKFLVILIQMLMFFINYVHLDTQIKTIKAMNYLKSALQVKQEDNS